MAFTAFGSATRRSAVAVAALALTLVMTFGAARADKGWMASGGELIDLPADEQASMLNTMASVAADVSKTKPALSAAYQIVAAAAQRVKK